MSTLSTGSRLGPYEITAKLGQGGMGEVWRATDTRLRRDVAIKVLPSAFTADKERLSRFEREAQFLAQLNHPSIAQIYGLEGSGETRALVMELVPGPTLAERLEAGPIPIEESLALALQIALALEEAHEKGIVHRDLKPQNIKASSEGKVKVLDFGLAKAMEPTGADAARSPALMNSPTLTAVHGTALGVILGTAAYMAPEQARGAAVDKRADIWAFGVVLFEMLSGRMAFAAATVPDTLAAVLTRPLDWGALPAATPPAIRQLLRRCLERNPRDRLRDIGEARLGIAECLAGRLDESAQPLTAPASAGLRGIRWRAPLLLAAASVLAALAIGYLAGRGKGGAPSPVERAERRFVLAVEGRSPEDRQAIAPDGGKVAYTADGGLWVRDLADVTPRRLGGADGAVEPFWSPDGREIGFALERGLWRVVLEGGSPKRICELPAGNFEGASWGDDGNVVFALATGGWTGNLLACAAAGGVARTVHAPGSITLRASRPQVLSGGAGIVFALHDTNDRGEVRILAGGVSRALLGGTQQPAGVALGPDRRLYYTLERGVGSDLWSVALDSKLETLAGEPRLVAEGGEAPSVASDGALVFAAVERPTWRLAWIDRHGSSTPIGEPFAWNAKDQLIQLSPDGRRASMILMGEEDRIGEAWIAELERGGRQRQPVDFEPYSAVWSPDGRELLVSGKNASLVLPVAGTGTPRRLDSSFTLHQPRFAPDGRWIVGYRVDPQSGRDLWRTSADGSAPSEVLVAGPGQQVNPDVSPDGRFLAYQSDESGRPEVYVRPYPAGERKWQVSNGGGTSPVWNRRGGELVWIARNSIWVAPVSSSGTEFAVGAARLVAEGETLGLELSLGRFFYNRAYDLAPDGERFLVVQRAKPVRNEVVYVDHPGDTRR